MISRRSMDGWIWHIKELRGKELFCHLLVRFHKMVSQHKKRKDHMNLSRKRKTLRFNHGLFSVAGRRRAKLGKRFQSWLFKLGG